MFKFLKVGTLIFAAWFLIHILFIVIDGLNDEISKSDVAVILGNKVNEDGTLSERLKKRVDKGIELYKDSLIKNILVSGGLGNEGYYEGSKMRDYLIENGIPKQAIIVDNDGNTTDATAKNFRRMHLNAKSIIVITQYFHITRTKLAFRNEGFRDVKGVHCNYFEPRDVFSIVREFFGYYKYLFL